jgi:hypothetical protein
MLAVLYHLKASYSLKKDEQKLGKKTIKLIFDMVGLQLKKLKENAIELQVSCHQIKDKEEKKEQIDPEKDEQIHIITFGWLLEEFPELFSWNSWTISQVIIRSKTNHLHDHVVEYIKEANSRELLLEKTAYAVAIEILLQKNDLKEVFKCQERMKEAQIWSAFQEKFPHLTV